MRVYLINILKWILAFCLWLCSRIYYKKRIEEMKFENTEVWGFEHAIRGMRNPLESWNSKRKKYRPAYRQVCICYTSYKRKGGILMHRCIIRKLDKKIKRVKSVQKVGVKTMSQAARRLEILDKVLSLFGMRVGAYQTADMDIQGDIVVGVRLTIYFMSSRWGE